MDLNEDEVEKAKRINRLAFVVLVGLLVVHWALMANCSGWSTRTMEVETCLVGGDFAAFLANRLYTLLFISVFSLLIPAAIYCALLWALSRRLASTIIKLRRHEV